MLCGLRIMPRVNLLEYIDRFELLVGNGGTITYEIFV